MNRLGFYILRMYLSSLAWLVLQRYRPLIIAIAGTTNKTFTKEAIEKALTSQGFTCASTPHTFNTAIGVSLSILGLQSGYNSYKRWLLIIPKALGKAWSRVLPKILILELGISHPKDVKYFTHILKPKILVITDITQRYRENFTDLQTLSREYSQLIKKVSENGLTIINYDTILVKDLALVSRSPVFFFSLEAIQTSQQNIYSVNSVVTTSEGIKTQIKVGDTTKEIFIPRFGKHYVSSYLIAEIVKDNLQQVLKS